MPDAEQFAKTMLWHVTKLQAELSDVRAEIDLVLSELRPDGLSVEFLKKRRAAVEAQWLRMYQEACRQAGLSEDPPSATPDIGEGGSRN